MFKDTKAFSSFAVNDVPRAKQFYGEMLGLNVTDEGDGLGLHIAGGGDVFLYPKDDHTPASFTVLNFPVEKIEDAVEQLAQSGVRFERYEGEIETDEKGIHRGEGPTIAWFKDPAGNILSVMEQ